MTAAPSPDQPTVQPLPPPPPQPASRRLHRSSRDHMLGGVCGGLAEYTDTDVVFWRVGFLVLALMGAGVLAYILLWIVIPEAEEPSSAPLENQVHKLHNALHDALGSRNRP